MKVYLSPVAERKIEILLEYLVSEWSIKSKETFLTKFRKSINKISIQPKSCPSSNGVYKCVVMKQASFYYRIQKDEIEVVTVIDNRQNPKMVRKELNKYFKL
jgi:plasmid stabilization system protein ParE